MNLIGRLARVRVPFGKLGCTLAAFLLFGGAALADDPDDPFDPKNQAEAVKPKSRTQMPDNRGVKGDIGEETILKRLKFTVRVEPAKAPPGGVVRLIITGTPAKGYHTYPMTQRTPQQQPGQRDWIIYPRSSVFTPLWPVKEDPKAKAERQSDESILLVHDHPFTWSQDIYVSEKAPSGKHTLGFTVHVSACDNKGCTSGNYPPLEVNVEVAGEAVAPTTVLQKRLQEKEPPIEIVNPPAASDVPQSLWGFILVSMGAAVLMLLTPCVFPMIPITVSFFLKQSEKEHHNALLTAAVYSLTIIAVLTLAVLALGGVIVALANNAWLNLGLGAVLVFFALSFFGMYEIELPSGLARFTSAREGRGGMAGAFFMALTFTITSFTCTGPFLGPLLVGAKESGISMDKLILGALAYSATFAAPFFLLALFPRMLKALPKSGGWLNSIKVVMGFLELAAALKFLANTDLALNPGDPMFFTYETVLCAWIALSAACGMYLLGVFRLPHDSPVEHIGVMRMLFATIFFGLSIYMVPALWRVTPQGSIGKGLVAFLPLDTREDLDWYRNFEEAWDKATKGDGEPRPIFVDFTGVNCTNCRYNEKNVFTRPAVRDLMKEYVRVQLYTDSVPEQGLTSGEALEQGERNRGIQGTTFKDVTNPFYVIIRPRKGEKPFIKDAKGNVKLNGDVIDTRKGLIQSNKLRDFERFLRDPLK